MSLIGSRFLSVCVRIREEPRAETHPLVFSSAALVGACGGNYSAMAAVVYSPDFPDTYATGRVCYWTIRVPGASHIHFNFTLFDIRDSADMVELLDGYTHRVLVRFNGRSRPPLSFNVSLDFVILYFFSDRINQAQGFAVLYQGEASLTLGHRCPGLLFPAQVSKVVLWGQAWTY